MKYLVAMSITVALMTAGAEEFSNTPKKQTLSEAIQYQKAKDAADDAQARKEAAEAGRTSRTTPAKSAGKSSNTTRNAGQADKTAPKK